MSAYRVFTIKSGVVTQGALVPKLTFKGTEMSIPVISVGKEGLNQRQGILPVVLPTSLYDEWWEKGSVNIFFAEPFQNTMGETTALIACDHKGSHEKIIAVFLTTVSEEGRNEHTGDLINEEDLEEWV